MKRLYKFTSALLIVLILSNCFLGDYLTIKTYALTQNEYDEITEENLRLAEIIMAVLTVAGMTCGVTQAVGIAGGILGAGFTMGSVSIDKDGYIEFDQEMFNLIQAKTDDYFNQTHYYGEFPSDKKGKVAYTDKNKSYSKNKTGSDTFVSTFSISTRTAIYISNGDYPSLYIAYYKQGSGGTDSWCDLRPTFSNGYYSWYNSPWYYNDVTVSTNLPLFPNIESMQKYLYKGDDSGAINKEFRPYNFNLIPHSATTPSNYRVQVYTPTVSENNTPSENHTPSQNNTPSQNKPYEPISFNDVPPSGNQITTDNIDYTSRFDYIIKQLKNLIDNVNKGFKTVVDKLNNNKTNTVSPNVINNYISNNNISNNNIYNYVSSNSSGVSGNASVSNNDTGDIKKDVSTIKDTVQKIKDLLVINNLLQLGDNEEENKSIVDKLLAPVVAECTKTSKTIKTKLPFSLPWDIYSLVMLMVAEPVTPRFEIPIHFESIHYDDTVVIDLGKAEILSKICRSMLSLIFAMYLIQLTRKFLNNKGD